MSAWFQRLVARAKHVFQRGYSYVGALGIGFVVAQSVQTALGNYGIPVPIYILYPLGVLGVLSIGWADQHLGFLDEELSIGHEHNRALNQRLDELENKLDISDRLEQATQFTINHYPYPVTVEERSRGEWAVVWNRSAVVNAHLEIEMEPQPSSRDETFYREYRFALVDALHVAEQFIEKLRTDPNHRFERVKQMPTRRRPTSD